MPVIVENGRRVHRVPGGGDIDLGPAGSSEKEGQTVPLSSATTAPDESLVHRVGRAIGNASPEIAAAGSALLAPETGGLSLLIPPAAAGLTEAAREYFTDGQVSPAKIATRAGLNAIPGVVGRVAGRMMTSGGVGAATDAMAEGGNNWLATLARGVKGFMGSEPEVSASVAARTAGSSVPASVQIRVLEEKLADPRLNGPAKAAVLKAIQTLQAGRSSTVANSLRSILGIGGAVSDDQTR